MILYIHGFGSTGQSFKTDLLKAYFPLEEIISPTLKHNPKEDFLTLMDIVKQHKNEKVLIVGTSLGAYYAYLLSRKFKVHCALINPSMEPGETLTKHLGTCKNYNTGESFEWTKTHLSQLKEMREIFEGKYNFNCKFYNVFLGEKDESLNHSLTKEIFKGSVIKIYPEENHRFSSFGILLEEFFQILNNEKN